MGKLTIRFEHIDGTTAYEPIILDGYAGEALPSPLIPPKRGFHPIKDFGDTVILPQDDQEELVLYAPDYQQLYVRIIDLSGQEHNHVLTARTLELFDLSVLRDQLVNKWFQISCRQGDNSIHEEMGDALPEIYADDTPNGTSRVDRDPQIMVIIIKARELIHRISYELGTTGIKLAETSRYEGQDPRVENQPAHQVLVEEGYQLKEVLKSDNGDLVGRYCLSDDLLARARKQLGQNESDLAKLADPTLTSQRVEELIREVEQVPSSDAIPVVGHDQVPLDSTSKAIGGQLDELQNMLAAIDSRLQMDEAQWLSDVTSKQTQASQQANKPIKPDHLIADLKAFEEQQSQTQ